MKRLFTTILSLALGIILCYNSVLALTTNYRNNEIFAVGQNNISSGSLDNFKKINTYVAGQFKDFSEATTWCAEYIKVAYEYGIMYGDLTGNFNLGDDITIAETITIAARLHDTYIGGNYNFEKQSPWYQSYVDYALINGIISSEYEDYAKIATRGEFTKIFAHAFPVDALGEINKINDGDIPDIALNDTYYQEAMLLYRAGIIIGTDEYATFNAEGLVNRGMVSAYVARMIVPDLRETLSISTDNLSSVDTLNDLETYLNKYMSSCTTPLGTFTYQHTVRERVFDFIIETAHVNCSYPWYELQYSTSISEDIKEETLNLLRDFQMEVYEIASTAFPDEPMAGGFCDSGYRYSDIAQVSSYALAALQWAKAEGLVNGTDTTLTPDGSATRAQVAVILMRFCETIK